MHNVLRPKTVGAGLLFKTVNGVKIILPAEDLRTFYYVYSTLFVFGQEGFFNP